MVLLSILVLYWKPSYYEEVSSTLDDFVFHSMMTYPPFPQSMGAGSEDSFLRLILPSVAEEEATACIFDSPPVLASGPKFVPLGEASRGGGGGGDSSL